MWPFKPRESIYLAVESSESGSELEYAKSQKIHPRRISWIHILTLCIVSAILLIAGLSLGELQQNNSSTETKVSTKPYKCSKPTIRKEWRSLSTTEKEDYIDAVKCLTTKQSKLSRVKGDTLYNDFPYVHTTIGGYSHGSAAFLAWHRLLLHNYEAELHDCGYHGSLTYWDWSLDWESLSTAPVFSNTTGFGGNGDPNASESVFEGHCVTTGPFALLELPFYDGDDHVHCLSRGFKFDQEILHGKIPGYSVRPEAVENILSLPDFETFFLALENGPHNAIPTGIRGDFMGFTAPNDPVFFLHHSQLDRLWWKWQQRNIEVRLSEYTGKARSDSEDKADLRDVLPMGGLAPDMKAEDVMNTESDLLCYTYA